MIDLSQMRGLQIDSEKAIVRTQSGFVTAEIDRATHEAGLVVGLSETPTVGISGLILGGGISWLTAAHGLASDNLVSAQVVLADGRIVTASAEENSDLFWALRGGGGNFGIVTEFALQAYQLPHIVEGILMYDLAESRTVLKAWRELTETAPDELQTLAMLMPAPKLPSGAVLGLRVFFTGPPEAAEPWIQSFRGLGAPIADTISAKTYLQSQSSNQVPPVGFFNAMRTGFLHDLHDDLIEALPEVAADGPDHFLISLLHWHGAACRVPAEATAFPHRDPGISVFITDLWQDPAQEQKNIDWIMRVWRLVAPRTTGAYSNLMEDEGPKRVRAAYGANYERLAKLKRKYDSRNFFRLNQNIAPAS